MMTDVGLAILAGFGLWRLGRALAGGRCLEAFALATLSAICLVVGIGVALLAFDAYSVTRLLFCTALLAVLAGSGIASRRREAPIPHPLPRRGDSLSILAIFGIVALALASPGYQIIAFGSDAGVYFNRAMQLEHDGRRFPAAGVDARTLPAGLRERFIVDNRVTPPPREAVIEGLKVRADGLTLEYHALPAWPVLMSIPARLLGRGNAQFVTVPLMMAIGMFMFFALRRLTASTATALLGGLALMSLPITVYFARYPTVELLLATLSCGAIWIALSDLRWRGALAGMCFATYALVHLSSFIPLLLALAVAPLVLAARGPGDRAELKVFLGIAGLGQLAGMIAGRVLSSGYMHDLYGMAFGSYRSGLLFVGGIALLAIGISTTAVWPWGRRHVA